MTTPVPLVVAITGASGTVYGIRALQMLKENPEVETHLILTSAAKTTLAIETDWTQSDVEALATHVHLSRDITAPLASGSFTTAGMLIAPCSIKTLSAVANSTSSDLVSRAADVTLKERRSLVLMLRETPLHLGHLRLMTQAAEAGAVIAPPVPAFYQRPSTLEDIIDHSVGRCLEQFNLVVPQLRRWEGRHQS